MIRSQPILPVRFYDDLFEQDRFNKFFQISYSNLFYPVTTLPHFQITRDRSIAYPTRFMLRNICSDLSAKYYKVVPEGSFANTESFEDFFGDLPKLGFLQIAPPAGTILPIAKLDCGKLVNAFIGSNYTVFDPAEVAKVEIPISIGRYDFKFNVDKFVRSVGSTFTLKIYIGDNTGVLLANITASGNYTYNFNNTTESKITIYWQDYVVDDDVFEISEIQGMIYPSDYAGYATDVVLDVNSLTVIDSIDNGVISYCQPSQGYAIDPGEYYYMVECGQEIYYSEVFRLKSLKEIENFYKITWWNSCDLNSGIIYDPGKLGCDFRNIVYLDAALFKPEYVTLTENTEDGENTLIPTFKKWQKSLNLEIANANEYLADALSGTFIHDNVFIKQPLNKGQVIQTEEFEIKEIIPEIVPIFEDAFQKVTLKFLLSKFYTKSNCCDDFEIFDCNRCNYVASDDPLAADYYLVLTTPTPDVNDGLYRHSDNVRIDVLETDVICNLTDGKFYKLGKYGNFWLPILQAPKINSAGLYPGYILVTCSVIPYTFAQLQYNIDGAGWVDGENKAAGGSGIVEVKFNTTLSEGASDIKFRVVIKAYGCTDYGTSPAYDYL